MCDQIFQVYDVESQSCLHTKALNKSPHAVKKLERNKVCPKGYVSIYSNYTMGLKYFLIRIYLLNYYHAIFSWP